MKNAKRSVKDTVRIITKSSLKSLFFILILTLLPFFECIADSNAGSAEYAMLHPEWPCQAARDSENRAELKTLRKAVLWNTFGKDTSCLMHYLNDPRLKSFQLHLINEVCQRNQNCGDYEFLYGIGQRQYNKRLIESDPELFKKLEEYLKEPAELINKNLKGETQCLISPGLESNLSLEAFKVLSRFVRQRFPGCKIVWNPAANSPADTPLPKAIYEMHGHAPPMSPPCNANLDGVDIEFSNRPGRIFQKISADKALAFIDRYKACENSFLWVSEFNLIASEDFIDPRKRTTFPTPATFDLVNTLIAKSQR